MRKVLIKASPMASQPVSEPTGVHRMRMHAGDAIRSRAGYSILSRNLPKLRERYHALIGKALVRCHDHEKVVDALQIQDEAVAEINNPLQSLIDERPMPLSIRIPEKKLYTIRDALVVGKQGYVFFDENHVFAKCPSLRQSSDRRIRRPIELFARRIEEPVFHLTGPNAENRGHYLVEQLPRLVASMEALSKRNSFKVLITPGASSWQLPLLEKLGISSSQCIEGEKGTLLCRELYYVPILTEDRWRPLCDPQLYKTIRAHLLPVRSSAPARKRAVFISRKDAPDKRLKNEDDVLNVCKRYLGYIDVVSLGGKSFEEQLALFRDAAVVIGPHGQPFRYSLLMSDCLVLQLCPGSRSDSIRNPWFDVYADLGTFAGNRCAALPSHTSANKQGDWTFPAERLEAHLKRLIDAESLLR